MDVRDDPLFLCRERELLDVLRAIVRGRHVLIVGEKGVGKTCLMREVIAVLEGRRKLLGLADSRAGLLNLQRFAADRRQIIFVDHTSPLSEWLKELAQTLHALGLLWITENERAEANWAETKKRLVGAGSVGLQNVILRSLGMVRPPALLFLDSLDRLTPTMQQFLESILGVAVVCGGVVRAKSTFHFRKIWASFTRVDLGPLSADETRMLIRDLLRRYPVKVLDDELYESRVADISGGNPFQVRNLLWQSSREKHVSMEEIRTLGRKDEAAYFNMGPLYIIIASVLTLFKIFSFGTDNREFYIYFSALGFLVYLIFRVFRTFFLFKPQRQR